MGRYNLFGRILESQSLQICFIMLSVFRRVLTENSKHRKFGCWYLLIRPKNKVSNPLEGIIKIEKMAVLEEEGLDSSVVDNISLWLLNESSPTCTVKGERADCI